jgi:hypothetical protein
MTLRTTCAFLAVLALVSVSVFAQDNKPAPTPAPAAEKKTPQAAKPADAKAGDVNALTADEQKAGWKLLFDGKTTKGWHGWKKTDCPAGWQVVNGALTRVDKAGDLATDENFANFELRFDWQVTPKANSGLFYRSAEDEQAKNPFDTAPEYQILDNAGHADGQNPKTSAASCYALYAPVKDVTKPIGEWNEARVVVNGNHVEHWLNGVKVVAYEFGSTEWKDLVAGSKFKAMPRFGQAPTGRIVLQDHGDKVAYRNIKILVSK